VDRLRLLTVGMNDWLIEHLWNRIAVKVGFDLAHIVHPSYTRESWSSDRIPENIYFLRENHATQMPAADRHFLASLECDEVPTIHNMIMSDRHVSKLPYEDALAYATFIARRFSDLYLELQPSVIIGGFDDLQGAIGLAVARQMDVPWYAMIFSVIPSGRAALCANLSPASVVVFDKRREIDLREEAERLLSAFEAKAMRVPAYIQPKLDAPSVILKQIPGQLRALYRVLSRRKLRRFLKYSEFANTYSVSALVREAFRLRKNLWRLRGFELIEEPIARPYAFFGLHMQPESSIDVFAHFYSNQLRVIELMARSLPPTHTLLVKLHKSDAANYSRKQLANMKRFPGVEIVSPYADTFELIRRADLVFTIQGTIGQEAALLGKPFILFGDSPTKIFPSASTVGKTIDLPKLVRQKLAELPPDRSQIAYAFARFLAPYYPATVNDWSIRPTDTEIDGYVQLFSALQRYVRQGCASDSPTHSQDL
jgi:hypothetical protein